MPTSHDEAEPKGDGTGTGGAVGTERSKPNNPTKLIESEGSGAEGSRSESRFRSRVCYGIATGNGCLNSRWLASSRTRVDQLTRCTGIMEIVPIPNKIIRASSNVDTVLVLVRGSRPFPDKVAIERAIIGCYDDAGIRASYRRPVVDNAVVRYLGPITDTPNTMLTVLLDVIPVSETVRPVDVEATIRSGIQVDVAVSRIGEVPVESDTPLSIRS